MPQRDSDKMGEWLKAIGAIAIIVVLFKACYGG